jgi:hypothetical protein
MAKLTLNSNTTDFTTTLYPPIPLDTNKRYEAAFLSLHTFNSVPNITENNNKFKYSTDKGINWKTITFARGAYELTEINAYIQREIQLAQSLEKPEIEIDHYKPTFKTILVISNENYMVDFGVENSIGSTLGFTNEKLGIGTHQSPNIIDIEKVNSILVHCDIIMGTYINSSRSNVIYNFTQQVSPGWKIIERPGPELIFLPVVGRPEIQSIRIWLTDQDNIPIDLMGERITIDILIKEKITFDILIREVANMLTQGQIFY